MKGGRRDEELEETIELLKAFLETADFKTLRAQSEKHLLEGRKVSFLIRWKEGNPVYEMVAT